MQFKNWMLKEDAKLLGKAYSDLLKDVPQDPIHHPEGTALTHIRLVRKAIPRAISELSLLKNSPEFASVLSDISFNVTPLEMKILYLSAWLHDIGKASATAIDPKTGRIHSRGHQDAMHYLPHIEKLKPIAPEITRDLYEKNADLINFLIDHHMDLMNKEGFSKAFVAQNFQNGKVINDQKMKLLLILMWADKMGRRPEETIMQAVQKSEKSLLASSKRSLEQQKRQNVQKASIDSPQQMIDMLRQKGVQPHHIFDAVKRKFSDMSDEDIQKLI